MTPKIKKTALTGRVVTPVLKNGCWVCGGKDLNLFRKSKIKTGLTAQCFSITDNHYGETSAIYRCSSCDFRMCLEIGDPLNFYKDLVDEQYEMEAENRFLQASQILKVVRRFKPEGRLLDVGAASGIFVSQAIKMGYSAEGIDPSDWLCEQAGKRQVKVYKGVLPHPDIQNPYDIVMAIDVIEHVPKPLSFLKDITEVLADDGIAVIVAPNVKSLAAKIFGRHWWHYRVAHIGYFDKSTLNFVLKEAGLQPIFYGYPTWYFGLNLLIERINIYLPKFLQIKRRKFFEGITVPLNLYDSIFLIARKI
ncbi:MAG: class I SAM-dependent methyltransferase [Nitrospinae bacterium]|nr:class I SAM-dependent methyltransferase [Nitrospinota bacterium]